MNAQSSFKKGKASLTRKVAVFCLILIISLTSLSFNSMGFSTPISSGIDITYEINITNPPEAGIKIKATYSNIKASLFRLEISYENYPAPTLAVFKDLRFSSLDGKNLPWKEIDYRTIEVNVTSDSIVANYSIDLTKTDLRATKVSAIGGELSGYEVFPVPSNQKVNSVKVKFIVPDPWTVVSAYPKEGEWFVIKPFTYEDISLETKSSGWGFGNIDFDYIKTYDDGFEIRVVGFKYFEHGYWNVYLGNTPLEEAMECADFYHDTYVRIKEIYGEFPLPKLLLIGPQYWQPGNSYLRQSLLGWYRYEAIPHHMLHAFFQSRVNFDSYFYSLLSEGYSTYAEGIMTAEITNNSIWRGMLYERKFHYIRGYKFNNMEQNSRSYVLGFIVTYLMDKEIRRETNNQKGIHDLMVRIWKKYSSPNFVRVSDDQVLEALREVTGNDWHWFYEKNIVNTSNLKVEELNDLKEDFKLFLKSISDYWYDGNQSMYFVGQEIVSAAGDFDQNVRMQSPMNISPNIEDFAIAAHRYKDVTQADLTEKDIEKILHQITGKDHSDFFEFYKSQGFEVDPKDITEFVRTFTYTWDFMDSAIKLIPNTFPLRQSTNVIGEIVDQDFANSDELSLQVKVYDKPIGLADIRNLITGKGVFYDGYQEFPTCTNYFFKLPKVRIGDKTYTFFTINLPQDAGVINYSFFARPSNNPPSDFIGLKKVKFQSGSTFWIKPSTYENIDNTPPVFSITEPDSSEVKTQSKIFCIKGLVEPEAKVLVNGKEATISSNSFQWSGCVELQPGENNIKIEAVDKAGNKDEKNIAVTYELMTFNIVASASSGGTISPSGTVTVNYGDSKTFTITPNSGYKISSVKVDGVSKGSISSYTFSNITGDHTISVTFEKQITQTVIILQIGNTIFTVNGSQRTLDSPPIIKNSRTLLPIRAVVEALGGTVGWNASTKRVTVSLGSTTIELWIGKSIAKVNGIDTPIDSTNSKVVPEIINSRTMLPLRFVTESLGCDVQWDGTTKTITITFQGEN